MNNDIPPSNSIPGLLRELRDETTTLLRQEVALAKSEMKENVSRMGSHAIQIAVGGFVAYAGIIVLLIGIGHLLGALLIRAGMDEQVAQWLAPSIVGLIVAIIGWVMLSKAKNSLAQDDLAPKQTIESMRENKEWAQNKLHPSS
jgi:predicted phage tail protein